MTKIGVNYWTEMSWSNESRICMYKNRAVHFNYAYTKQYLRYCMSSQYI